jgi:15-cis-phytoene synthase
MSAAAPDQTAAAYCASLVRASDFERYAATLFVKEEQRRALLALFAFNIEIARVREQISQPLAGEIRLQWWSDLLDGAAHGEAEANPVAAELLRAIDRHALPLEVLSGMIDAHRFDLYDEPMQTATELEHYLVHTASALFSLGVLVLGGEAGQLPVRDAGLAYGLARIIQALPAHASRGQMYLPLDELAHAGVAPEDVFAGKSSAGLQRLLQELAGRARTHLQNSFGQMVRSQVSAQALLPLALVDRRLRRIMSAGYKPFDPPQQPSNLGVLWALWRASRSKPFL